MFFLTGKYQLHSFIITLEFEWMSTEKKNSLLNWCYVVLYLDRENII